MALARAGDALMLLDPMLSRAEHEGRIETVIQIQIYRSLALRAQGDATQALVALERALTLAEPSGYIRIFVDEGEPLRPLIADFTRSVQIERQAHGESRRLIEYTHKLLAAFPQVTPVAKSAVSIQQSAMIEPLSERELDVLRLLPSELSTTEMANELVISVNTLRTHLKSIYDKLGAHSRYEAVARAREWGLL